MSTRPFAEGLPRVAARFALWEIFAESEHYLDRIEATFSALTPSYDLRFTAHAPISDINIASFHPEVRSLAVDIVERTVRAAGRMGIPRLTVHPGLRMPMARWDDAKLRRMTLESATRLAALGAEVGVEVCLENMPKNWVMTFQDPEWFADTFGRVENLRFCFDMAHAHTNSDAHVTAFADGFVPYMGNVHVSDNDRSGDTHWVLGKGTVPVAGTIARVERGGYKGAYVLEASTYDEGVESLPVLRGVLDGLG